MKKLSVLLLLINIVKGIRDPKQIEYREKKIYVPTLDELRIVLENALMKNFAEVSVEIVENPDLTQEPFYLASSGIGGDATIIEYGSGKYLIPLSDLSKVYDLVSIIREIESYKEKDFFACGAGPGPFEWINQNCEGIFNMKVFQNGSLDNESYIARILLATGESELLKLSNNETRGALFGNIFLTEGKQGKVLKVVAKTRTGEDNFISAMRLGLTESYPSDKVIGLGGVFLMKTGKATIQVIGNFSETPIAPDMATSLLTFHEMPAPLIVLGAMVSQTTDFALRLDHFHCFSKHNHGGHFLNDTTPEIVEYEGYFNVAERVILIDKNATNLAIKSIKSKV